MAQSTFYCLPPVSIDSITPADGYPNAVNIGVLRLGGTKAVLRRLLTMFDVFGAAADGRPLRAGDILTAAELLFEVGDVEGTAGIACRAERVTRPDWDYLAASWNNYKTGSAWTAGGGDVGTPPAALAYYGPTGTGPFAVAGALDIVTDAAANRGGLVNVRHMIVNENPVGSAYWAGYGGSGGLGPRIRVTYTAADPLPVSEWADDAGAAHGAPAARAERAATPAPPARASRAARR